MTSVSVMSEAKGYPRPRVAGFSFGWSVQPSWLGQVMQFADGFDDPQPHSLPVDIASRQHFVGLHGGGQFSVRAVLAKQQVGGAEDVEVGGHARPLELVLK